MYYIYRVTNNINSKTYIGQHKYKRLNDSYMGSGKLLKTAYRKYGKENFTKTIIHSNIETQEMADNLEKYWISYERLCGKAEYNIADGGHGGASFKGHKHSDKGKQAISESSKARWADDDYRNKVIASRKATYATDEYKLKASISRKGHKQTEDWVYKRTRCAIGNKYTSETKWFNNGTTNIRLKSSDIVPEGFVPGRMYFHRRRRK